MTKAQCRHCSKIKLRVVKRREASVLNPAPLVIVVCN